MKTIKLEEEQRAKEFLECFEEALTNARRKANTQIKDEQSLAHTHTAINQIDNEVLTKLRGKK